MNKYYLFAIIPILLAIYFWIFTQAFQLLRAQSDLSVFFGVTVIAISLISIIKVSLYVGRKIKK